MTSPSPKPLPLSDEELCRRRELAVRLSILKGFLEHRTTENAAHSAIHIPLTTTSVVPMSVSVVPTSSSSSPILSPEPKAATMKKRFPGYRKAVLAVLEIDAHNDPKRSRYGRSLLGLTHRIKSLYEVGNFRTGFLKRTLLFLIEIGTVEKANPYRYRTTASGRRQWLVESSTGKKEKKKTDKKTDKKKTDKKTDKKKTDKKTDKKKTDKKTDKKKTDKKTDKKKTDEKTKTIDFSDVIPAERPLVRTHKWQFLDGDVKDFPMGTWRDYDPAASDEVEKAYRQYQRCPGLCDVRRVKSGHFSYMCNFLAMTQLNVDHSAHTQRPIRRVDEQ